MVQLVILVSFVTFQFKLEVKFHKKGALIIPIIVMTVEEFHN